MVGRVEKDLVVDTLIPRDPGASRGRAPGRADAAAGGGGDRAGVDRARLHQHALAGRGLVPAHPRRAAGLGRHRRAAPRLARPRGARLGRGRAWKQGRLGRRRDLVARPRRRLPAGRARAADRSARKGIARLLQRGGRSGHAPGGARGSRSCRPTRSNWSRPPPRGGRWRPAHRPRTAPDKPLDVLVQHLVSIALGGGFAADALFAEVRTTPTPTASLTRAEFDWALAFVEKGGRSPAAYPEYRRVRPPSAVFRVPGRGRAGATGRVGTIVSEPAMAVAYLSGGASASSRRLHRPACGRRLLRAGRVLELVRTREMTAYVTKADRPRAAIPVWSAGACPVQRARRRDARQVRRRRAAGCRACSTSPRCAPRGRCWRRRRGCRGCRRRGHCSSSTTRRQKGHT